LQGSANPLQHLVEQIISRQFWSLPESIIGCALQTSSNNTTFPSIIISGSTNNTSLPLLQVGSPGHRVPRSTYRETLFALIWSLVVCPKLSFTWGGMGGSIGSFDNCNDYNDWQLWKSLKLKIVNFVGSAQFGRWRLTMSGRHGEGIRYLHQFFH